MSRMLRKSQQGYIPDELDSCLEELGLGYYLDSKLVEAESNIEAILSSEFPLSDHLTKSGSFEDKLAYLKNRVECLSLEGEADIDDITGDIDSTVFMMKTLKPTLDESEITILFSLLNTVYELGKKVERFNQGYILDDVIRNAVMREASSINQSRTGQLNLKYQYKQDVQSIVCQTLSSFPTISRSSLAEKLLQYMAKKGVNAPSKSSLIKWIMEVDKRAKGYPTQSSLQYDLVLKPQDIKPL